MTEWEISSNEEAYIFSDVSYFSRFNRDIYDTLENVQLILVCGMLLENADPSYYWQHLTSGESILLVDVDVASAFLIWMIELSTDKI